jgi:ABC-2 type transport system ATP-binding protein
MPEALAEQTKPVLRLRGVEKRYGKTVALDGLDLTIPAGSVFGLIGPNGAGKTTTFGIVGGYVRADAGTVDILGLGAFDPARHAGRLSLLPQDAELNREATAHELCTHYGRLQQMSVAEARREADRVIELVALGDRATSRMSELSHGMRRRVAIGQALIGNPELVLLDEPTSGLDPELVVHIRELFASQRGRRTLVLSSHNLAELEAICDHVAFIQRGRCHKSGSLESVTQRGTEMRFLLEAPVEVDEPAGIGVEWQGNVLTARSHSLAASEINQRMLRALLAKGARIIEVRQGRSLEAAYLSDLGPRAGRSA